jgi:hypothetical protein
MATVQGHAVSAYHLRLVRDSTAIGVGDAAGSRIQAYTPRQNGIDTNNAHTSTLLFLDSPATTSAIIYAVQIRAISATTIHVNRTVTDTDNNEYARGVSTITLMEVAG